MAHGDLEAVALARIRPASKQEADGAALAGCLGGGGAPEAHAARLPGVDAAVVRGVLSDEECEALLAAAAALPTPYSFWNLEAEGARDFRNTDTVEVLSERLAAELWRRLERFVPEVVELAPEDPRCERGLEGRWRAAGVNPHLLFCRYPPGGHFSPHTDGRTVVSFNERSHYSVLVYLNTCAEGGETRLYAPERTGAAATSFVRDAGARCRWPDDWEEARAEVRAGETLLFFQDVPHEGAPVGAGCVKHLIRTDIMYRREPPVLDSPDDAKAFELMEEAQRAEADGDAARAVSLYRRSARLSPGLAEVYGFA